MEELVKFQIHVLSICILVTLLYLIRISKVKSFGKKIIYWMIISTFVGLLSEPIAWILDSNTFKLGQYYEYIANLFLFIAGPALTGFSLSYVDFYIFGDVSRVKKRVYYQQATIITAIILIINTFYPLYFSVNPSSHSFSAGPIIILHYVLVFILYGYLIVLLIQNTNKIIKREQIILLIFFTLPILGILLQMIEVNLFFAWTAPALGILGIYVFLESTPSDEDFLTKIYNRKSYDLHIQYLITEKALAGIILMDLNDFKAINDTYGHTAGDEVLIAFSVILKHVFHTNGFVARLGGDEFAVILENNGLDVEAKMLEVTESLMDHPDPLIQRLGFSYGYEAYKEGMSSEKLYFMADANLYKDKELKKKEQ